MELTLAEHSELCPAPGEDYVPGTERALPGLASGRGAQLNGTSAVPVGGWEETQGGCWEQLSTIWRRHTLTVE